MHKTFTVARGRLFSAPINISPGYMCNILDLGCGTGIWSIDVAESVCVLAPECCDTANNYCAVSSRKECVFVALTSF
jgi:ubiquinone/menaquinone biosynthesis C-methylase UbiE